MHRSRVAVLLVDHSEAHDAAVAFWAGATGSTAVELPEEPGFSFCVVPVQAREMFEVHARTWG